MCPSTETICRNLVSAAAAVCCTIFKYAPPRLGQIIDRSGSLAVVRDKDIEVEKRARTRKLLNEQIKEREANEQAERDADAAVRGYILWASYILRASYL